MKRISQILSVLTAFAIVFCGCTSAPEEQVNSPKPDIVISTTEEEVPVNRTIVYVPLDDRPNNYECMAYRAQALGYGIIYPDQDLYATRLNNQPLNSNNTMYGNRAALYEWVLEMEETGHDYYVLFLDQLLSGGIVNSRAMTGNEPLVLSDGTTLTEEEALSNIFEILGKDSKNRVWLLDTVMRLAPTVGYLQWDLDDYNNCRNYFSQPRLALEEDELSLENIFANYCTGPDGKEINPAAYKCSSEDIEDCIKARSRKMQISQLLLDLLETDTTGIFSVLYGIDDSANSDCIQTSEIQYINSRLGSKGALLSGVDDMCFKALAKMYLEDSGFTGGKIDLVYVGGLENEPSCIYDYKSIIQVMEEHLNFFGFEESDDAELKLVMLTRADKESKEQEYIAQAEDLVKQYMEQGLPVAFIDDTVCTYEGFPARLTDDLELGRLISYSGRLDMANVIGTCLSHAVSRYAFLKNGDETVLSDFGHMKVIADGLIKDLAYRNVLRSEMDNYIKNTLGGDPNNFYTPEVDTEKAQSYAAARMEQLAEPVIKNLESSSYISSLKSGAQLKEWGSVICANWYFPWSRTFELSFDLGIEYREK